MSAGIWPGGPQHACQHRAKINPAIGSQPDQRRRWKIAFRRVTDRADDRQGHSGICAEPCHLGALQINRDRAGSVVKRRLASARDTIAVAPEIGARIASAVDAGTSIAG